MLQTIEVEVDTNGYIHPLESVMRLPTGRALLTFLDPLSNDSALLAESALAEDWRRPEEDEAWAHLQPGK
jgi:hypothetical protein